MTHQQQRLEQFATELDRRRRLEKRLRLLDAIHNTGSLTAAAKLVGVSYKTAWNHIREMNQRCESTVLDTQAGGTQGGGSVLTETGKALMSLLRIQRNGSQQRLADKVPALRFSARNQLPARITSIDTSGVIARVGLAIGQLEMQCHITSSSIDRLELTNGSGVYAIIKASTIELSPGNQPLQGNNTNCLPARVSRCTSSSHGRELELTLGDGLTLALARPFDIQEDAWIYQDAPVYALIEPEEIMLATSA
ncbi:TOBE domain-containing protein [Marinobacterium mangrovicola]|uniref:Molybdate transport repressor ModE n=1 Tax=Marinobacterium mangrovicola TaxID=1476959 RepID=A0A4V6NCV9_9GAMM|nr:TOBE domain-containing protein [Marinobacterium mangrovicola]TCK02686.1 molybdate transport repressor ModE [Marinobacterium mangrovicola]